MQFNFNKLTLYLQSKTKNQKFIKYNDQYHMTNWEINKITKIYTVYIYFIELFGKWILECLFPFVEQSLGIFQALLKIVYNSRLPIRIKVNLIKMQFNFNWSYIA